MTVVEMLLAAAPVIAVVASRRRHTPTRRWDYSGAQRRWLARHTLGPAGDQGLRGDDSLGSAVTRRTGRAEPYDWRREGAA